MKNGEKFSDLVNDIKNTFELLVQVGIKLPDSLVPLLILNALPDKYDSLTRFLENKQDLSIEDVEDALDRETVKIQYASESTPRPSDETAAHYSSGREPRGEKRKRDENADKCHFCSRTGHKERYCWVNPKSKDYRKEATDRVLAKNPTGDLAKKIKSRLTHKEVDGKAMAAFREVNASDDEDSDLSLSEDENLNKDESHYAFITQSQAFYSNHAEGEWLVDTCATDHICSDKSKFTTLTVHKGKNQFC
jgi:hypothetical protein